MNNEIDNILNFSDLEIDLSSDEVDYATNPKIKAVESTGIKSTVSFKEPITNKSYINNAKKATGKKFILKTIFIDAKTQKRIRVELTPSVCPICAFDVAEKNGFVGWFRVPSDKRALLLEALEEHKTKVHFASDALIIDESQIPDRWLGSRF